MEALNLKVISKNLTKELDDSLEKIIALENYISKLENINTKEVLAQFKTKVTIMIDNTEFRTEISKDNNEKQINNLAHFFKYELTREHESYNQIKSNLIENLNSLEVEKEYISIDELPRKTHKKESDISVSLH